jgi:hypothetical protein
VRFPKWFAALNDVGALRYQLTPIGGPAPELHVAKRASRDGSFVIAGGRPRQEVCWQVTGVRRDAAAKANPVVVEQSRRAARPVAVAGEGLSEAAIRRQARQIQAIEAAVRKDGAARERLAKLRKPAKKLSAAASPRVAPDQGDAAAAKLVKRMVSLTRELSGE